MEKSKGLKPKSIKVNYILSLIYEVFSLLTPLITAPYISRVLGAEGVGVYSYTDSIAQYFILFGNLGIATYGQMEIARNRDDEKKLSQVFAELWLLRICTMVISFYIYMVISFNSTQYREAMLILGLLIVSAAFDLTWLFRGIEDFSKVVIRNFIIRALTICLIFLGVRTRDDIYKYILLIAVSNFAGNLTFLVPLRHIVHRVKIKQLSLCRHIKPCLIFFVPTIATSVYKLLDKTMLGLMTEGSTQNGYYEQAHKIEQMLIIIITSLNTIMRSRMTFLYEQNKLDEMKNLLKRSLSFILIIAIPMTVGLIAIAPDFIPIFLGEGFSESIILLQIFALLLIVIGLSNCINTHFLGPSGRQGKNNYVLIFGALINFFCNLIVIPKYGAVGAACTSVFAEAIILIGYLVLSRDFISVSIFVKLGWRYLLAGIIMFIGVNCVDKLNLNPFLLLILKVVCGGCIYFVSVFVMRDPFAISNLKILWKRVVKSNEV